ncbi:MAG: 1-deoxy-D-xylulose-5-phosphate reductoisomerase [Burkholderiales bacterium]|jgi:1-deoxy-D-xylulose-5-phosphate reductoisomerase|nr:1-deoxy-D-xylulose-5-phosphate reductoisomerase [Burkholderiales bacterium]
MQRVAILGATGSIGRSTLDVIARHPERFEVAALTANRQAADLVELAARHRPRYIAAADAVGAAELVRAVRERGLRCEVLAGPSALAAVAASDDVDTVMAAIVGAAGLASSLAAAAAGKKILLANKEALVMAGPLFMQAVAEGGASLLPIDSEHNAIFQCLPPHRPGRLDAGGVRRILLTGSGGPFRTRPRSELASVTPDEACAHPTWNMGRKISVDSATMMNKALEIIEAHWLFGVPSERIEVVVHPQSVVHSMVEYADGSVLAQLGHPDMRTPIAQALAYPERIEAGVGGLDLAAVGTLSFERPDFARFPALPLAYRVLAAGGTAPATFSAANEVAVAAFLAGTLPFLEITRVIETALARMPSQAANSLEDVLEADRNARTVASAEVNSLRARAA